MDRVMLLVDETGDQISALLNPASLSFRRQSGLRPRRRIGAAVVGGTGRDAPLVFAGDAVTELELELLFDADFAAPAGPGPSTPAPRDSLDVRRLTAPIWRLSEAADARGEALDDLPQLFLIWGRATKLRCRLMGLSERLERFDAVGIPRRSWLALRFRVFQEAEEDPRGYLPLPAPVLASFPDEAPVPGALAGPPDPDLPGLMMDRSPGVTVTGGARLDEIAARWLGSPADWRWLAVLNDLTDPLRLEPGSVLSLPPPGAAPGAPTTGAAP
ncbi:hypothetical protein [Rhodovulum sp. MB263]|uniref:CIS tube protein n=1 Tax=unclassified Rhodovulum TaxID=2631432 RepID=UPI0009B7CFA4|nr:hypothetical protein [Rhodovulum sp. MB263]ARC90645.1 hypothetical protein B5V46_18325 [Rhodovulum sp. MB263]